MWILWDNLTATLIVSTVVLLLLVARQRMMEVNIEQTSNLVVRTAADSFSVWLEEDLDTMGDLLDLATESPISELEDSTYYAYINGDSIAVTYTKRFAFQGTSPGGINRYVAYEMKSPMRREISGKSLLTFTFQRYTSPNGLGYEENGGVNIPLSDFRVDFLDGNGNIIANPLAAAPGSIKNTRVRFAVVTPYDVSRSTIRELYYGSTLLLSYN